MTGGRRRSRGGQQLPSPGPVAAGGLPSAAHPLTARGSGVARDAGSGASAAADQHSFAHAIALRQLTVGPRTRAQLATAMRRKGVPDDVAQAVLDRLTEVQLVDDHEFSRQWVTSRHVGRGLARRALAYELRQRGVEDGVVRDAVDELTADDELAAARELVRRRLPSMAGDDSARRIRRLAGMLARKGYSAAIAMRAIREELAGAADDVVDAAEDVAEPFTDDEL